MTLRISLLALCIGMASAPAYCEDEAPARMWVEQHAKTADFAFLVQLTPYGDLHASHAIQVIERLTGKTVQLIEGADGLEMSREPAKFLRTVDLDADGHPDLRLAVNDGGAGPNSMDNFYLFDPATGKFTFHAELSELPQVSVDRDGKITSAGRGSCCHHGSATYRLIRGKLTPMTSIEESLSPDGKTLRISTGTYRGGKMHYTSKRRPIPKDY
jgi:hypothetical protein